MRLIVFVLLYSLALASHSAPALVRQANTTLRLPETPPRFGFATERAFGSLAFPDPVAIVTPPGETNRVFVVEQDGRISVITNLAAPTRTIFLDIVPRVAGGVPTDERGLLGLAFHPGYLTNRFFYVFYTGLIQTSSGRNLHDIISRFEISPANPNVALPDSEVRLITQHDQADNHNGGDLHFGPDGYLYIALGDEGGANDQFNNSQRIDLDFFAGLLRIDVDKRPGNLPPNPHPAASSHYSVPADNPFVGATSFNGRTVDPAKVRTEFYAVGLRNPWRITFDRDTGLLYAADVGQGSREEIHLITKGGNYGWAFREGNIAGPKTPPAGFAAIEPIHWYTHGSGTNRGNSVTGGVVYRGKNLSQLAGKYVFADYVSGNIWALTPKGTNNVPSEYLTRDLGIAGFGIDPSNGDILFADQSEDTIKRLIYSAQTIGTPLPETLSQTGAFSDLAALVPHAGIVPYNLNLPFWSDTASKTRWFSIPDPTRTIDFSRTGNWSFPNGTVWIKHFEIETRKGDPSSKRRLETRFIVRNKDGVYGLTYRWDEAQRDATLVPEGGLDENINITDGAAQTVQTWHYPSRSQCAGCHTAAGGFGLGFNSPQLNRDFTYGATQENQIRALRDAGYFSGSVDDIHTLPAYPNLQDDSFSLEYRVRSYLAVNCAQCHQPGAPGLGKFNARADLPLSTAGIIDGQLLNNLGNPANRVVAPGSIDHSVLLKRISTLGTGRMPPFASSVVDSTAVALLSDWIMNVLPSSQSFAQWQAARFGSTSNPNAAPDADPDSDGAPNLQEYLAGRDPLNPADAWRAFIQRSNNSTLISFSQIANRRFEVQATTNLFDPASWKSLDVPGNALFYSRLTLDAKIQDPDPGAPMKFYRVRLFE